MTDNAEEFTQETADAMIALLKTSETFSIRLFAQMLGCDPKQAYALLDDARRRGLVKSKGSKWRRA